MGKATSSTYQLDSTLLFFSKYFVDLKNGDKFPIYNTNKITARKLICQNNIYLNQDASFSYNFTAIIDKLVIDGYLKEKKYSEIDKESNEIVYEITFDGRCWIEGGGYQRKNEIILSNQKFEKTKENALIYGTWLAGIGTSVVSLIEMGKLFLDKHFYPTLFEFWTLLFLVLSSILMGAIIVILCRRKA